MPAFLAKSSICFISATTGHWISVVMMALWCTFGSKSKVPMEMDPEDLVWLKLLCLEEYFYFDFDLALQTWYSFRTCVVLVGLSNPVIGVTGATTRRWERDLLRAFWDLPRVLVSLLSLMHFCLDWVLWLFCGVDKIMQSLWCIFCIVVVLVISKVWEWVGRGTTGFILGSRYVGWYSF